MKLGIGIDTGGTYTDAVIYDFDGKAILGSAKALTTKQNLTIGILGAIDGLPLELVRQAEVISLSTTLATNACVEDKGGRAKLIFFGGDPKVIDRHGPKYGLPPSQDIYIQESFTTFSGGITGSPDWAAFSKELETGYDGLDGVGILEMNAMRNGGVVEQKAKEIFREKHPIPVVCGNELFSELNCLQRASSTLLNAGLFPVIREFLASVKKALAVRDLHPAALVIVRSDGSFMSEEFAALRPVETLLCGPAASAMGCAHLTGRGNRIMVDMGGTTTDIALMRDGVPVTVTGGVSIGKWKTFVDGLYIKTFGLGGDSAVHYRDDKLILEEYRVIPLCVAAEKYPSVVENLKNLPVKRHTRFLYEHFLLTKDIAEDPRYTQEEKAFCQGLRERPLLIADAAAAVDKDIYTLDVSRLLKDGVVQLCGLTPTDVMHIKGDFTKYNAQASRLAAGFAAYNLDVTPEAFCDLVYEEVKRKLYLNIVTALLENKYEEYGKNGVNEGLKAFILTNFEEVKAGTPAPLLSAQFRTDYTLVGAGAPIGVFLEDVAKMLGTHSIIPPHHQVANALGAITSSVSASCSVEIELRANEDGLSQYLAFGTVTAAYAHLEDAIAFAREDAVAQAVAQARNRGAAGELTVTAEVHTKEAPARGGTVYLGTTVTAHAAGAMGF